MKSKFWRMLRIAGLEITRARTIVGASTLCLAAHLKSRLALAIGGAIGAIAFGLTGHAQSEGAPVVGSGVVALHVAIARFWIVAPLTLWPSKSIDDAALSARHRRFGAMALTAIPVLFVAGLFLAMSFGAGINGLVSSSYGAAIATKAALALAALAIGAWNRLHIARLLETGASHGRAQLRFALLLDLAIFVFFAIATTSATTVFAPR